ncbi:hypothetical protein OG410_22855 [Streptomyces sp. NBC_00659]|uniref:hypothetical protein n=1 Tax=Streptomyces sp. NBC_00659 TaxID=2903669 RepID=UPI002E2EEE30|nr:hypothetical protein [Streptomyces sp. NBC_00659]
MSKPDTRRLDRAIRQTNRKLEAVRRGEQWPLTGSERRQMLAALAGGSYRVMRGKSTTRADNRVDAISTSAETRLIAEMTALQIERQRIVTETARAKAAKKSSGWW